MADVVSAFTGSWSGVPPPDLDVTLRELYARASASQPAFIDYLLPALAAHAPAEGVRAWLDQVHVSDFAMAAAAAQGNETAMTAIETAYGGAIHAICRRFEGKGHTVEDLQQTLRAKLFVGAAPAIRDYNGQGQLASWLRVIATRLFIDLGRRKDRARELTETPREPGVEVGADLVLDLVKAEYRGAVLAALDEAARQLDPGDRHLLRQHLVFGLTIDQVGAVLGIHRATAARRITRAREQLAARARALVAERLELSEHELAELFGLVISKLDLSLRRLLESQPR